MASNLLMFRSPYGFQRVDVSVALWHPTCSCFGPLMASNLLMFRSPSGFQLGNLLMFRSPYGFQLVGVSVALDKNVSSEAKMQEVMD